jgi:phosphonate transport system substrate-binding protein
VRRRQPARPAVPQTADKEAQVSQDVHPQFRWHERGKGEAVLLLHGLMGDMDHWTDSLGVLSDFCRPIAQVQLANGSLGYRSCLIAHSDADIFSPEDIGGKSFAFNDPNSTSGYLVPMTFFLTEMGIDPKTYFSKLTFSGSHEASIIAVANKKVDVASTNLPDMQQLVRENKVPRASLRVIWVSKLIPNDPVVVRKDLPAGLRQAIQDSFVSMKVRQPQVFVQGGAFFGGFVQADDSKYQIVRDLNETTKKLAAKK